MKTPPRISHNNALDDVTVVVKKSEEHTASTVPPSASRSRERRYIFSGDPQDKTPGYAMPPANRRFRKRRRRNGFNIVVGMFLFAVGAVAYISNLLTVQQLSDEIHRLQQEYERSSNMNAILRAEISRKSALERIGDMATQQLGLIYPRERPQRLDVDAELLERFRNEREE